MYVTGCRNYQNSYFVDPEFYYIKKNKNSSVGVVAVAVFINLNNNKIFQHYVNKISII